MERKGSTWLVQYKSGRTENILVDWVKSVQLKKETEGLLLAAQDQALPTSSYKVIIMKEKGRKNCWMCNTRNETVMHIISEFEKLANGKYI